jgi:hypothetical protein
LRRNPFIGIATIKLQGANLSSEKLRYFVYDHLFNLSRKN